MLPKSLKSLSLGLDFQQNLQDLSFPLGIQKLTLQSPVSEILEGVELPSGLESLNFGDGFNDTLDQVQFPRALKTLTFGDDFNQSLEQPGGGLSLFKPQNGTVLQFYNHETTNGYQSGSYVDPAPPSFCSNSSKWELRHVSLPESLKSLTFGYYFNQPLDSLHLPDGLLDLLGCLFAH